LCWLVPLSGSETKKYTHLVCITAAAGALLQVPEQHSFGTTASDGKVKSMLLDTTNLTKIPWAELIRAKTLDELQMVLIRTVGSVAAILGSSDVREPIARAAAQTAARQGMSRGVFVAGQESAREVDVRSRLEVLSLVADIDDICPPYRHFPWPFPLPWPTGPEGPWGPGGPGGPVERDGQVLARDIQLVARIAALATAAGLEHIAGAARSVMESVDG
jgi:hypothetical protein